MLETTSTNPENKYDNGQRPRMWAWAAEDDMIVQLIGRGVFVGWHKVTEDTVQDQHRQWIGHEDGLIMLDGGGHAWLHECDDYTQESATGKNFDKWLNGRRVNKVPPQHKATVQL